MSGLLGMKFFSVIAFWDKSSVESSRVMFFILAKLLTLLLREVLFELVGILQVLYYFTLSKPLRVVKYDVFSIGVLGTVFRLATFTLSPILLSSLILYSSIFITFRSINVLQPASTFFFLITLSVKNSFASFLRGATTASTS